MKKLIAIISVVLMLLTSMSIAFAEDATTTETADVVSETATDAATETTATETTDVETVVSEETGEGDVSVTPDSPLWGVKRAIERIDLALTLNKAAKSEKGLKYARIRLLEVQKMLKKGDFKNAARAEEAHGKLLVNVRKNIDKAKGTEKAEKVKELEDRLSKNIAVLEAVKAKLEAKGVPTQGIENALAIAKAKQECRQQIEEVLKSGPVNDENIKQIKEECRDKLTELVEQRKEAMKQTREGIAEQVKEAKAKRLEKSEEESETEETPEVEETETSETSETESSTETTTA